MFILQPHLLLGLISLIIKVILRIFGILILHRPRRRLVYYEKPYYIEHSIVNEKLESLDIDVNLLYDCMQNGKELESVVVSNVFQPCCTFPPM